jgi:anti-sigma B factor antagonist
LGAAIAAFDISTTITDHICTMSVVGEVDVATAPTMTEIGTLRLHQSSANRLVIDLAECTFLDSTGIGAIIQLRNTAKGLSKDVVLSNVPARIGKILAITGLDTVLTVAEPYESASDAVDQK